MLTACAALKRGKRVARAREVEVMGLRLGLDCDLGLNSGSDSCFDSLLGERVVLALKECRCNLKKWGCCFCCC